MEKTVEELIEEALKETAKLVLDSEVSARIIMPYYRTREENEEAAIIRYSEQELKENFLRKVEKESMFYYSVETPSKKVYSISNSEKPAVKVEKAKEDHFESARFDVSLYENAKPESLKSHIEFKHDNKDEKEVEKDFLKLAQEIIKEGKNYFVHYLVKGSKKWESVSFPSIMKKYNQASNNKYIVKDTLKNVVIYLMIVNNGDEKSYKIWRFNLEEFKENFITSQSYKPEDFKKWEII